MIFILPKYIFLLLNLKKKIFEITFILTSFIQVFSKKMELF